MKLHVALGGLPFEAVQVTVVVPLANAVPDAGTHVTVGTGHPSAVGGVKVVTAVHCPGSVFFVMFAGQVPIVTGLVMFATSLLLVTAAKFDPVICA